VAVRRISSPVFVGRRSELAALDAVLARAGDGDGSAVLVEGEAGIGKSRLMARFESRGREAGLAVLVGECLPLAEGELAFAPIVAALRPVMLDPEVLAGLEPALRSALGPLWPVAGSEPRRPSDREQLFEAVYRVLAGLAARQPVLLIIEDVHWVDPSSRDLLSFLVHNARRDRLVVVATYRPDELHRGHPLRPFVAELERSGRAGRLELAGLDRADVTEQIRAITGRQQPGGTIDAIFARSEGNPFFVEELLASSSGGAGLPSSLREALLLRVAGLTAATRAVLGAAAAIGRSVDHRLLASVAGGPESDLLAALREATEHHVLVAAGECYRFRHALLREAIYEDTLPGERLRLHRLTAQTLAARPELAGEGANADAELAHHWYAAGELPAALASSVRAAAQADLMHAHPEAVVHLQRAFDLWPRVPGAPEVAGADRVTLLLRASKMAEDAGDDELGLEYATSARRLVDARAEPLRAAAAESRIGHSLWNAGRADEALAHLAEVLTLVPERPPSAERARALASHGRLQMLNGAFRAARGPLEEALELAGRLADRASRASVLNTLAIVYDQLGDRQRAIAAGRDGLRIATELGDGSEMLRAYVNGSQAIDNDGRVEEALALGLQGVEAAHRLGLDRAAGDQLSMQAAWRLIRLGRHAQAGRVIRPAFDNATLSFNIAATRNVAGFLAAVRGDFDHAEALLDEAWEQMQHSGGLQLIGLALAWRITLCVWRGELERAARLAHDGVQRAGQAEGQLIYTAEMYWLAVRVQADRALRAQTVGDWAGAREAAQQAEATAAKLEQAIAGYPGDGAPPEALAFDLLVHSELRRAGGKDPAGSWRAAAEAFAALRQPSRAAYAEMREAEAMALAGAPPRSVAVPLQRAHAVAVDCGIAPFRAEVEELARRARVDLPDQRVDLRGAAERLGLTEREAEVLALLAEGRTNRQIGQELFITEKTASVHVSRILGKLGVTNRGEAAAAAHRVGLAHRSGPEGKASD
jgi:DNA-binding CsgD family transcriptional regulator/tetratricopeptide (TPR) repeat protein